MPKNHLTHPLCLSSRGRSESAYLQSLLRDDPESLGSLQAASVLTGSLRKLTSHQNSLFVVRALLARSIEHTLEPEVQKLDAAVKDVMGDAQLMEALALGVTCKGSCKNLLWFMEFFLHHRLFESLQVICEFALDSACTEELLWSNNGNLVCQRALLCANFFVHLPVFGALLDKAMLLAEHWMLATPTPWTTANGSQCASHFIIECCLIAAQEPTRWAGFLRRCHEADPEQLRCVCRHKTGEHLMAHLRGMAKRSGHMELADMIAEMLGGAVASAPLTTFESSLLPGVLELR